MITDNSWVTTATSEINDVNNIDDSHRHFLLSEEEELESWNEEKADLLKNKPVEPLTPQEQEGIMYLDFLV